MVGEPADSHGIYIGQPLPRFSLVAEIGWLARGGQVSHKQPLLASFSLVAEIGWLASPFTESWLDAPKGFQSRCRDWVVGENAL